MSIPIVQRDEPVLRDIAQPVDLTQIGTPELQAILNKMSIAMASQKDGVAIAAPQIGESLRIFMVSGSVLKHVDPNYTGDEKDLVFINPVITKLSREKRDVEEGCLSVRWLYGKVRRSTRATITAYNEKGEKIERGARGLMAQIFQHETDHLNGILFIDTAKQVWEMSDEEIAQAQGK